MVKHSANSVYRLLLSILFVIHFAGCTSSQKEMDDDLAMNDSGDASASADSGSGSSSNASTQQDSAPQEQNSQDQAANDFSLDDKPAEKPAEQQAQPQQETLAESNLQEPPPASEPPPTEVAPVPVVSEPAPQPTPAPVEMHNAIANITGLKFRANDNGGTLVIEADQPISYTTRVNQDLHQFVIEVANSKLPKKLQRGLNTKDIEGAFGSVDAYQNSGSQISRFVIQLREGAIEPAVQQEGNVLLVVASPGDHSQKPAEANVANGESSNDGEISGTEDAKILNAATLDEFLSNNTQFFGKKISIETNNIEVKDALKFLMEESGVNMVISEEVRGSLSLKLRQVPWDQALVLILKAKKLGYSKQGSVLRIAPINELKSEEEDATKLVLAKRNTEPLRVRMYPISYAKVDDLEKKIKDFLSDRGKVISDSRTNSVVVTDTDESLTRIAKVIKSLDVQPPQVLIEGKIVEAKENFLRSIGVNWNFGGAPISLGKGKQGAVNLTPSFGSNPAGSDSSTSQLRMSLGTLEIFGNLDAALSLNEREQKVKVISAPRVVAMTNENAQITQSIEIPIQKVTPSTTGGPPQTTYDFKELALKLDVTPQITNDASVIMKVNVKREFRDAAVSVTNEQFAVNRREASSKVIVKNGETTVIAGIYQSDATESETGVPGLRDLPVLGFLFKGRSTTKDKSELLIFLTPRIMGQLEGNSGQTPTPSDL